MICMQIDSNPNSKTENLFNGQKLNSEFLFFFKKKTCKISLVLPLRNSVSNVSL